MVRLLPFSKKVYLNYEPIHYILIGSLYSWEEETPYAQACFLASSISSNGTYFPCFEPGHAAPWVLELMAAYLDCSRTGWIAHIWSWRMDGWYQEIQEEAQEKIQVVSQQDRMYV